MPSHTHTYSKNGIEAIFSGSTTTALTFGSISGLENSSPVPFTNKNIFILQLRDSAYANPINVYPQDFTNFTSVTGADNQNIKFTFSGFVTGGDASFSENTSVTLTFFESGGFLAASSEVSVRNGYLAQGFIFPYFGVSATENDPVTNINGANILTTPAYGGRATIAPEYNFSGFPNATGGPTDTEYIENPGSAGFQMFSFYNNGTKKMLYFQTDDIVGIKKAYLIRKALDTDPRGIIFYLNQFTNTKAINYNYTQPYLFKMKPKVGDWYDACLEYKTFAKTCPWLVKGSISKNTEYNKVFKNIELGFFQGTQATNKFQNPSNPDPIVPNFNRYLSDVSSVCNFVGVSPSSVVCNWFNGHGNLFDHDWPDFIPNSIHYTGVTPSIIESYTSSIKLAHDYGFKVHPYTFVNSVGTNSDISTYLNLSSYAFQDRNLTPSFLPYYVGSTSGLTTLNMRHEDLRKKVKHVWAPYVTNVGVDGMYFDTLVGSPVGEDYNTVFTGGFNEGLELSAIKDFLSDIRLTYSKSKPDFYLTSEFVNEMYIPFIDTCTRFKLLTFGSLVGSTTSISVWLDLWETIYHEYFISTQTDMVNPYAVASLLPTPLFFGATSATYFKNHISNVLHSGQLITLGGLYTNDADNLITKWSTTNSDIAYDWIFLKNILSYYKHIKKYLLFGEALRPINTFNKVFDEYFKNLTDHTSIWKDTDVGSIGVLLTNCALVDKSLVTTLPKATYGLQEFNNLYLISPGGVREEYPFSTDGTNISFTTSLSGFDIKMFELTKVPILLSTPIIGNEEVLTIKTLDEDQIVATSKRRSPEQWVRDHYSEFSKDKTNISFIYRDILKVLMNTVKGISYINAENDLIKVQRVFSNQERAIAELSKGDTTVLPIISIERKISNTDKDRRRPTVALRYYTYKNKKAKRAYRIISPSPTAVNIEYNVNIWSNYQSDMDQIIEQIRTLFNPSVQIKNEGKSVDFPCFISEEEDISDQNVRNTEDREIKRTIKVSVEGYIPPPTYLITATGRIEVINSEVDLDNIDL